MSAADLPPPTVADLRAAAGRLVGQAVVTPLLESSALNRRLGGRLLIKAEPLQRTGSFKFRGAFNALAQLDAGQRRRGVVAFSSGNHAQGVAAAAQILDMPAVIVMPVDAPAIKVANTRGWGAEIVFYDRLREDREALARALVEARGATLIAPYDDPRVIAGQGTIGLEIAAQAAALGLSPDVVIVPCGGGGLIAGTALALAAESPSTRVYAAEPEGFDDTRRSLAAGMRLGNDPAARSFCDALLAAMPGALTFAINRRLLAGGFALGEAEIAAAMTVGFAEFKLVIEPGGAVAVAAALCGRLDLAGKVVVAIASGGNVDSAVFRTALQSAA